MLQFCYVTRSRWLLLIGIAIAVLVAGCGSSSSSSSGGSASSSSSATPSGASSSSSATAAESSSLAAGSYTLPSSVQTLTIDNDAGSLQVTVTQGSSPIHVVQRPTGDASAKRSVAGSSATIVSRCPGGFHLGECAMDYEVTLPATIALDVKGSAGDVSLQGGPAKVDIHTSAAKVSGAGLARGSYTVATEAGEVDLGFSSAPSLAKVTTEAGDINVTVPGNASYRVTASSEVGDTKVAVPNDPAASNVVDLHAQVGDISVRKG